MVAADAAARALLVWLVLQLLPSQTLLTKEMQRVLILWTRRSTWVILSRQGSVQHL